MPDGKDPRIYRTRLEGCQKLMSEMGIDFLFLAPGPNMYYLSAFLEDPGERLLTLIVPRSGDPLFVVPEVYEEHVRSFSWIENIVRWKDSQDPKIVLSNAMRNMHSKQPKIGVDGRMWSRFLLMLLAVVPDASYEEASTVMGPLRIRKTKQEIELLEKSAEIADAVFNETLKECGVGIREKEVSGKIACQLRRLGADGVAFEPVVASGPNAALPHYRSGERRLQKGDLLVLDFGCVYRGYNSDITRTVAIGDCDAEKERAYSTVRSAQEKACQKAHEGMEAQSVDTVAREIIEAAGCGQFFVHRTGHGIGLEIHEEPYIVEGNSARLANGMAFSVEPGIYVPGKFGVRIEDIVVIELGKARRLNKSTRELMTL